MEKEKIKVGLNLIAAVMTCLVFGSGILAVSVISDASIAVASGLKSSKQGPSSSSGNGPAIFKQKCAQCHFSDRTEAKMAPGLKGLFKMKKLPVSGRPVTEANIKRQLETPYDEMPAILDLSDNEIRALIAYLKTL